MPHNWLRGEDSNLRPLGYEPNELPTAPPRDVLRIILYNRKYYFVNTYNIIYIIYYMKEFLNYTKII